MTGAPVNCPFCKKPPRFSLGKKTGCSLHGEPMQDVLLVCDNRDCPAKPSVRGGDRYALGETGEHFKRGEKQAREKAVEKWNQCAVPQAELAFISGTLKGWLLFDASAKAKEGIVVTEDTHLRCPPTWPTHGQLINWIKVIRQAAEVTVDD